MTVNNCRNCSHSRRYDGNHYLCMKLVHVNLLKSARSTTKCKSFDPSGFSLVDPDWEDSWFEERLEYMTGGN